MAHIEKRTTKDGKVRFKAQVRLKGHAIQTATFERLTDAKRWVKQIESAILEGRHFKTAESKKRTLRELIERYEKEVLPHKPRAKQENLYRWWKGELGRYVLADITPALIGECRDKLLSSLTPSGKTKSPGTVLKYLVVLSHALKIACHEWGWIEQSPMEKVRKPSASRGRVRFLSDDERIALLKECQASSNKLLYPLVVLCLSTGLRKSEALNLTWSDIDFTRQRLHIHDSKNGDARGLPLLGLAHQLLLELKNASPFTIGYVFPGQNGQKPVDIRSAWENALKRSGVMNFHFHDLRHCCASYLAMGGASLLEIANVLGHRTLACVKRYSHIAEEHSTQIVEKMNAKIFGA